VVRVRNKNKYRHCLRWHLRKLFVIGLLPLVALSASKVYAQQSPLPEGTTAGSTGGLTIPGVTTGDSTGGSNAQSCELINDGPCGNVSDVGSLSDNTAPMSQVGNPVSLFTGNKYQRESDYQSSASKLQFNRHYNSHNSDHNFGIGQGWSSTYSTKLYQLAGQGFDVLQGSGQRIQFRNADVDESGREIFRSDSPAMGYIVAEQSNRYRWVSPDGRQLSFQGSYLVRIDFPGAPFLTLFYRDKRLSEIKDEAGRLLLLEYYPSSNGLAEYSESGHGVQPNHLAKVILPDGKALEYNYDSNSNLTRVRYGDGTSRTYHYDNELYPRHITGITNRNQVRYANWSYDDLGRAVTSEHVGGVEKISIAYFPIDPATGIGTTEVINSLDQMSTYEWQQLSDSGQTLLLSSYGPGCSTCPVPNMRYTYNSFHQVVTATQVKFDAEPDLLALNELDQQVTGDNQKHYSYDVQGRLSELHRINATGESRLIFRKEYEGNSTLVSKISKPSVNPSATYDALIEYTEDRKVSQITERGYAPVDETRSSHKVIERTTKLTYENGLLSAVDGPRTDVDDVTRLRYDVLGRLASVNTPSGRRLVIKQYDSDGRPTEFQIGNGYPLHLSYDANGNISEVRMRLETVSYEYDAESQLIAMTDPWGKRHTFTYDDAGRMASATDDMGLSIEYLKDSENRLTQRSMFGLDGTLVKSINYAFDAENRLQARNEQSSNQSTGNALSSENSLEYDELDRLVNIARDDGGRLEMQYDDHGKVRSVTESGVLQAQFEYDASGRVMAQLDARGNRTETVFDDFGRVIALVSPDSGTTRYRYDLAGNRTRLENAEGEVTEYVWDVGNRLVRTTSIDGVSTFAFHPENGRLVKATNLDSAEEFEYNKQAKLIQHTRTLGGKAYSTSVAYNDRGQVERKELPDGQALRYHYHQDGVNIGTLRAITREKALGLGQETLVAEIDLEVRDGQTGYLSHNGVRTQRKLHADGSIKSLEVSNTLSLQYTFDDSGNISGIDEDGVSQSFAYERNQLVLASTLSGEYAYAYDDVGNRIASYEVKNDSAPKETDYTYAEDGKGNRLLGVHDVVSGVIQEYEYNEAGAALKAGDEFSYVYNAKQRPIEVYKAGELVAVYRYNMFGERVQKTVYIDGVAESTYYLYDGHTLVAEIDNSGQVTAQYLYLQDRYPVVKLDGKAVLAIHTDHLGTPRKVTNDDATLVWDANYTPFGKADVTVNMIEMNLRFPGQYEDAETGTHYNYFRNYDPGTGRYTTSDPIGLQGGVNTYAYASANPLLRSDILGLEDDGKSPIDKIKDYVKDQGEDVIDKMIEETLGTNFVAVATKTLGQIPGEFDKLAADPIGKYANLPLDVIKPLFDASNAVDMAYTFAVLLAAQKVLEKGANFAGKTPWTWLGKEAAKRIAKFGMAAYIGYEFGAAAKDLFKSLGDLGDRMISIAEQDSFSCEDTEQLASDMAKRFADIALEGNLSRLFSKIKIRKPDKKNDGDKCKPTDKEIEKCYEQKISHFKGLGLTAKHIAAIEDNLGVATICSGK